MCKLTILFLKCVLLLEVCPKDHSWGHFFSVYLFIYDIIESSTKFNFIMYADDTTLNSTLKLFGDVTNIERLQHDISTEMNKVMRWLDLNILRLNVLKTKYMFFICRKKSYLLSIFHNTRQCD